MELGMDGLGAAVNDCLPECQKNTVGAQQPLYDCRPRSLLLLGLSNCHVDRSTDIHRPADCLPRPMDARAAEAARSRRRTCRQVYRGPEEVSAGDKTSQFD